MHWLAQLLRRLAKLRFRLLNLATIRDIPTDQFTALARDLAAKGWRKYGEYDNFDAWIDYGSVSLRKGFTKLKLEWDNWTEGSIEGPRQIIEAIAKENGLPVTYE